MAKGTDRFLLGVLGGVGLVLLLCVCCIALGVGTPLGMLFKSGAGDAAKAFLKADPQVAERIGEIRDFGLFPSGGWNETNGRGRADFTYSLKGTKGEGRARVVLAKEPGKEWAVVSASLEAGGRTFVLKAGPGEMPPPAPEPPEAPPRPPGTASPQT